MRRPWRFEGEVTWDCAECARVVAVHESLHKMWYPLYWLFMVLIGRTVYLAFDEQARRHVHASYVTLPTCDDGSIFQMRIGGMFRRNQVHGRAAGFWKIVQCWYGYDVTVRDYRGWTVGPFGTEGQQALFEIMERCESVEALLREERLAVEERDRLGAALTHAVVVALEQRSNGYKSRLVQDVRMLLQAALTDVFPPDRRIDEAAAIRTMWRRMSTNTTGGVDNTHTESRRGGTR